MCIRNGCRILDGHGRPQCEQGPGLPVSSVGWLIRQDNYLERLRRLPYVNRPLPDLSDLVSDAGRAQRSAIVSRGRAEQKDRSSWLADSYTPVVDCAYGFDYPDDFCSPICRPGFPRKIDEHLDSDPNVGHSGVLRVRKERGVRTFSAHDSTDELYENRSALLLKHAFGCRTVEPGCRPGVMP